MKADHLQTSASPYSVFEHCDELQEELRQTYYENILKRILYTGDLIP
jgi:hypothetical protein